MSESGLIQELAETRQKLAIAEDGKAAALRLVSETAAELARVQAENERLREALEKKIAALEDETNRHFARECRYLPGDCSCGFCAEREYAVGVMRELLAALADKPAEREEKS